MWFPSVSIVLVSVQWGFILRPTYAPPNTPTASIDIPTAIVPIADDPLCSGASVVMGAAVGVGVGVGVEPVVGVAFAVVVDGDDCLNWDADGCWIVEAVDAVEPVEAVKLDSGLSPRAKSWAFTFSNSSFLFLNVSINPSKRLWRDFKSSAFILLSCSNLLSSAISDSWRVIIICKSLTLPRSSWSSRARFVGVVFPPHLEQKKLDPHWIKHWGHVRSSDDLSRSPSDGCEVRVSGTLWVRVRHPYDCGRLAGAWFLAGSPSSCVSPPQVVQNFLFIVHLHTGQNRGLVKVEDNGESEEAVGDVSERSKEGIAF